MQTHYKAYSKIYQRYTSGRKRMWLMICLAVFVIFLFLPWTQNIQAGGAVTTLFQNDRPQQVNTIIGGQISRWYIKEGDFVKPGDTLLQLSEVNVEYLDPNLLARTKEQLNSKQLSLKYYQNKVNAGSQQISAIENTLSLKLSQLDNKIMQLQSKLLADSAEYAAAVNDLIIGQKQLARQRLMFDSGLVSVTQLEGRNQQYQNALAKKVSAENKLAQTKQDLMITRIEKNAVEQENREKVAKVLGDQFQSLTQIATNEGDMAKLQNQYESYRIRNGMYYVLAPQSGQVVKAQKAGIGEFVKSGDMIAEIVPDKVKAAVEIYVEPVDLPLLSLDQKVMFLFDGFPAIVFSGWPQASAGTFAGRVVAIESNISANGKFRVLVKEDPSSRPWPAELKMGTGARGIALLKDVPVWYELWRNINSFPPDYYQASQKK